MAIENLNEEKARTKRVFAKCGWEQRSEMCGFWNEIVFNIIHTSVIKYNLLSFLKWERKESKRF